MITMKFGVTYIALSLVASILTGCASEQSSSTNASTASVPNGPVPGKATESHSISIISDTVYFATDSSILSDEAQDLLKRQVEWIKQYLDLTFTVEGHADERGTREYNLALGERRAIAVANYLVALGIDKGQFSIISYGKERPVCTESAEGCWSQNRRGVTSINQ